MTLVNGKLITTAGVALSDWQVRGVLFAASPVSLSGQIVDEEVTVTATDGSWALDLVPNSLLAQPAGSYYSIEVREPPSGEWVRIATCSAPPSGPVNLMDILVVPAGFGNLLVLQASPQFTGTVTIAGRVVRQYTLLVDAATVAVDASLGDHFRLLLTSVIGATRVLGNPTNPPPAGVDQMLFFELRQDAAGGHALTFGSKWRLGTDIAAIALSTGANKTDYLGARYNPTDDTWDIIAFAKGY